VRTGTLDDGVALTAACPGVVSSAISMNPTSMQIA
jgi:hypothetical protein